jgi:hypothetical protein
MGALKACIVCGGRFWAKTTTLTCSAKCCAVREQTRKREYYEANRERWRPLGCGWRNKPTETARSILSMPTPPPLQTETTRQPAQQQQQIQPKNDKRDIGEALGVSLQQIQKYIKPPAPAAGMSPTRP